MLVKIHHLQLLSSNSSCTWPLLSQSPGQTQGDMLLLQLSAKSIHSMQQIISPKTLEKQTKNPQANPHLN